MGLSETKEAGVVLVKKTIKGKVTSIVGTYVMTPEDVARNNTELDYELNKDTKVKMIREVIAVYAGKRSTVVVCEETKIITVKGKRVKNL